MKAAIAVVAMVTAVAVGAGSADARRGGKASGAEKPKDPLMIVISLGKQRLTVFNGAKPIANSRISSGRPGYRTPKGVFSILQKRRRHYSNIYAGASMPNMQRLTWSGIAMHAGHLPGYPASHGCIRLPYSFSRKLFGMTQMNGRVVVTRGQPRPAAISHDNLLKPLPPGMPEPVETTALAPLETGAIGEAGAEPTTIRTRLAAAHKQAVAKHTDAVLSTGQRTRASVAAERRRNVEDLTTSLETAKSDHEAQSAKLREANAGLLDDVKALRLVKLQAKRVEKRLSTARAKLRETERKMRAFILRHQASTNDVSDSKAEQLRAAEDALEAEHVSFAADVDLIAHDLSQLSADIDKKSAAMAEKRAKRDAIRKAYTETAKSLRKIGQDLSEAKRIIENADKPITVVISRKTKTLKVRQGWGGEMLVADVDFEQPDAPLGTQVFFAHRYSEDGADLRWYALTADTNDAGSRKKRKKNRKYAKQTHTNFAAQPDEPITAPRPLPAQTPHNAIARVKIPVDVKSKLAEFIKPGSAIIVTDEGRSPETGKYTDLIVTYR